ncbi:hypothetical protein EKN40_05685 [Enterobacter hormaechei]|nr:hypothetical protein EKN36_10430 [Enterobacter hormaechei]RTP80917.1 hypothetical protein EKN40_05685 [Enterobacter hormaechei]
MTVHRLFTTIHPLFFQPVTCLDFLTIKKKKYISKSNHEFAKELSRIASDCQRLPLFAIHLLTVCYMTFRCKMTCCPEGKYSQNRELPEAGRTRPALYGLCEVARCTLLFLLRLLPLPRH